MPHLQPFFTERVFQIFDKDNSGSISLQEFIDAMHQFAGQSPDDKIRFLFKVYDLDGKICSHLLLSCFQLLTFACVYMVTTNNNGGGGVGSSNSSFSSSSSTRSVVVTVVV
jgi:Ca2+-binding EF-hand superfamily protein